MGIPDEHVHHEATGEAAKTVAAHSKSHPELVAYFSWFCPFVQRTWIALEERGIDYEYKEVNPYKKEEHFLKINPRGLVPALETHGKALYESIILCEWLEDQYPDKRPSLFSADPFEKARERIGVDTVNKKIITVYFKLVQAQETKSQDEAREELVKNLKDFMKQVKGPFFAGDSLTLPDVAIAPFFVRFYIIEQHRKWKNTDVSENFAKYVDRLINLDSIKRTSSEVKFYEEIYGRYLKNEAQSEMAKGTRAGTGGSVA